jgi:hypothetical protein
MVVTQDFLLFIAPYISICFISNFTRLYDINYPLIFFINFLINFFIGIFSVEAQEHLTR